MPPPAGTTTTCIRGTILSPPEASNFGRVMIQFRSVAESAGSSAGIAVPGRTRPTM